jgi:hypothetical protein
MTGIQWTLLLDIRRTPIKVDRMRFVVRFTKWLRGEGDGVNM